MHVPRLPRRLFHTFPGQPETEYPNDIPTPVEIKCESVQVSVPPSLPALFQLHGLRENGQAVYPPNAICQFWSWSQPYVLTLFQGGRAYFRMVGTNMIGQPVSCQDSFNYYIQGTGFITPGGTLKPRRDLVIGSDRIVNPTIDTPCPTWRFTGGNCPPNSLDCGNCCLDCASVAAGIDGVTALVLPISTWRKR